MLTQKIFKNEFIISFKYNVINLNLKITPWVHILLDHLYEFQNFEIKPYLLTCHAAEGHHRQVKRDFSHSLHSTKRKNCRC